MPPWWFLVSWTTVVEAVGVAFGLAYVLLAARQDIRCWPAGIVSSALGGGLMVHARLYSEAGLYVFYIVMGVVGWVQWSRRGPDGAARPVVVDPWWRHLGGVAFSGVGAVALGTAMITWTDAAAPWLDAATTAASLWATWLTARKVLGSWWWWVVIDAVSVGLYSSRGLPLYGGLMALYTGLAVWGWWRWRAEGVAGS